MRCFRRLGKLGFWIDPWFSVSVHHILCVLRIGVGMVAPAFRAVRGDLRHPPKDVLIQPVRPGPDGVLLEFGLFPASLAKISAGVQLFVLGP